jgi:hypothetical protein
MNKLIMYVCLVFASLVVVDASAQRQRVIRDVVLLDREPYEVLMSENGDIISRIMHLPNYLTSAGFIEQQVTSDEPLVKSNEQKVDEINQDLAKNIIVPKNARVVKPVTKSPEYKDYYEIEFAQGTATLSAKSIAILNELAKMLHANPNQKVQVFGFQNESPIIALLLSKRRRDACIAYLKIKGVRIDRQISKGSITEGANNKIVFGFE